MTERKPRNKPRTRADKAAIVARLHASAEANGGTPVWSKLARETGVGHELLREWWGREKVSPIGDGGTAVRKRRTLAEREAAMVELHASAEANGGTPVWVAVAGKVGISRHTLRKWWDQRARAAHDNLVALPPPTLETPDAADPPLRDPLAAPEVAYLAAQYRDVTADIEHCRQFAPGALPAMYKLQQQIYRQYQAAREASLKSGPQSDAEVVASIRAAVPRAPAHHRRAMVEALRATGDV